MGLADTKPTQEDIKHIVIEELKSVIGKKLEIEWLDIYTDLEGSTLQLIMSISREADPQMSSKRVAELLIGLLRPLEEEEDG